MSGAAAWNRMSDAQKAPWRKMANNASKQYAVVKSAMSKTKAKASVAKPSMTKPSVAKPKAKAKLSAAKSKAKPKVKVAKLKVGVGKTKSTKGKVAGIKKSPKTIRKIKVCIVLVSSSFQS